MQMPKEKIDTIMFAPCGMNCTVCHKHCYHKKPCAGCLNSDKGKPEHCRKCKIKDCIREKSLSYYFEIEATAILLALARPTKGAVLNR